MLSNLNWSPDRRKIGNPSSIAKANDAFILYSVALIIIHYLWPSSLDWSVHWPRLLTHINQILVYYIIMFVINFRLLDSMHLQL